MPASTAVDHVVSHFELEEVLGSGGMGIVYRALDTRLKRAVALKFVRPLGVDSGEMRQRFLNEARAAAALDHPNICTIFEVDETESGDLFIAMAYYRGQTLDRIVSAAALSPIESINIAVQIARGLAAAHDELIVHRDIKPANVMVTSHQTVKILDFGLALLRGTLSGADEYGLIGTPAYMSPEQLRGEAVDQRADVWALGAVLYEMLTGRPAFSGETPQKVVEDVLLTEPPPLVNNGVERLRLEQIIRRALQKEVRRRYDTITAMLDDLMEVRSDIDPSAITLRRPVSAPHRQTLAVLPFVDMSPQHDQEHLCDGLAEEILRALTRVPDLRVASRTSAFQFKAATADVREIGARLNVESVLEGSVRRVGNRLRVAVQLVNVADGYRLWYERFDRHMEDLLEVEDEIAEKVADALQVTLRSPSTPLPERTSLEAESHSLYLQGRQFFHQHRRKSLEIAIQTFHRAIEVNPRSARAYAGLADCHAFLRLYFGAGTDAVDAADEASITALKLAPSLPEARASRGLALFLRGEFDAAESELQRAVEIDPTLYDAHYIFGRIDFSRGNAAAAAIHFQTACTIVPEAYDSWYLLGMCYRRLGEEGKARSAGLECIEAVKKRIHVHPDDTRAWTMGAAVLVTLGEPDKAAEWVGRAIAIDPEEAIISYNAACVYTSLGLHDEALRCLERWTGTGGISRAWVENDPDLDPLREEPRFKALIARIDR